MVQSAVAQIEYNIYTFDRPTGKKAGMANWRLNMTTANMVEALQKAKSLYDSDQFHKVEVKKKFFDAKKGRVIDMTLKNFEEGGKQSVQMYVYLAAATMAGVLAFTATYFLFH